MNRLRDGYRNNYPQPKTLKEKLQDELSNVEDDIARIKFDLAVKEEVAEKLRKLLV